MWKLHLDPLRQSNRERPGATKAHTKLAKPFRPLPCPAFAKPGGKRRRAQIMLVAILRLRLPARLKSCDQLVYLCFTAINAWKSI